MPRGDTYQVSSVRGLRWEDFPKSGSFHAYVEVDDLSRPAHPVSLSTATGPENFVGRLRTAIEKAGGTRFAATVSTSSNVISVTRSQLQRPRASPGTGTEFRMAA